jgi:putative transposase
MIKTFKTKLLLTKEQQTYFNKAFGIRRWTWNWGLARHQEVLKEKDLFMNNFQLQRELNNTLVLDPAYSWLSEVNSMVRQEALKDLDLAIKAWRKLQYKSKRDMSIETDKGKPKFQKKGKSTDSFRFNNKNNSVRYVSPHFVSMTRVRGYKPFRLQTVEKVTCLKGIEVKTTTVSREHGEYFIAFTFERTNRNARSKGTGTVGIDLGVKHAAATYDGVEGKIFDVPESFSKLDQQIALRNQRLARTQKGSKRHILRLIQLQRAQARKANIRKDFLHKFTTWLVSTYDTIKVDDFSFQGFLGINKKNPKANKKAHDVAPYTLKLMLEYKAQERGNTLIYIPVGTPTTKTCSSCGKTHEMSLSDRVFTCECGVEIDRDINAAINVFNY